MKEKDYTPTLEDVKPFINQVTLNFDTRKNWGAADSAYVKMAQSLLGYPDISMTVHSQWGDVSYEMSYCDFLRRDFHTNSNGEFEVEDGDGICAILDWDTVRNRLWQVSKFSRALCDESLFLCRTAIVSAAGHAVRDVIRNEWADQKPSNTAIVQLSADKWERVCKFYEPETYSGSPYRKFVHDPWVTAKADTAVVIETKELVFLNNNCVWRSGKCVFVPEGGIQYERDYPMDYWD